MSSPLLRTLLRPTHWAALLAGVALGGSLLLTQACRAASQVHWPVPPPPPLDRSEPVLWVALAAHLGPRPGVDPTTAPALKLESQAGPLMLSDARGRQWRGSSLNLLWRRVPLKEPLSLQRTILGPFPSFERAEQVAQAWRQQGVSAVIAHPGDWEVWGGPESPAPSLGGARLAARQQRSVVRDRLVLGLREPGGFKVLEGPLQLSAPSGLRWGGGLFKGPFRLQSDAYGSWSLIEQVPLERYLQGVLPHEIGAGAPAAALEAQAVLARTWAVRNRHRFQVDGYHLCADTQCQVYADPRQAGGGVRRAIDATRSQVLLWQGRPIHAVYHASNGGMAAGFEEAWGGEPLPYLKSRPDGPAAFERSFAVPLNEPARLRRLLMEGSSAHGSAHPRFRWQRSLDRAGITAALGPRANAVGEPQQLNVLERGASGRVLALEVRGKAGGLVLRFDAIRRTFRQLPSTLFVVTPEGPGRWSLVGGGFGHGAGLSQAGALDLAQRGWLAARILKRYYPGTTLQSLPLEP
ncbi:SpoIID/LytB domain-containing protein [Cyanobium sp. Morenito 9A2]|uniref:SpoIID/LytB domain-containing protein n=1 Tax=Cyanobium sp. Morenito 9A2 TaxID=2823718 RepID=UPI0020CC5529|nr:SpoIID/LytB domain-containing protein [Cyanobium sp. Morenito 9A2]